MTEQEKKPRTSKNNQTRRKKQTLTSNPDFTEYKEHGPG